MCGIIGGISKKNIVDNILNGLLALEYRGYDSVGIAVINDNNKLIREKSLNRVKDLINICNTNHLQANIALGHTRWATHGEVSQINAHPHFSNDMIAVVHNGIIENYLSLKHELQSIGYEFISQTDSEVIAHLIHYYFTQTNDFLLSVKQAVARLNGAYAIGIICNNDPTHIICVSNKAPLILAIVDNEIYFASDLVAILSLTNKIIYLEDGDIAYLTYNQYTIFNAIGDSVKRNVVISNLSVASRELGQYKHYMQKEIFEQPQVISDTLQFLGNNFCAANFGNDASKIFKIIDSIQIIACGTSYNAGLVAKYFIETITAIPCAVDIASEYRYKEIIINPKQLIISISQSGETADTIACIKHVKELGMQYTLSICNVDGSSLHRLCNLKILTRAGIEIGVASTKAFSTQLLVLLYLSYTIKKERNQLDQELEQTIINDFIKLPQIIQQILQFESQFIAIANELKNKEHLLVLGRNIMFPIAIEGALKIKEVSYIHAEAYAAGELKHGPIALIDNQMPIILLMAKDFIPEKVETNLQEILARNGIVYLITDLHKNINLNNIHKVIKLPNMHILKFLLPIIFIIPLQLLAYHTALMKGTDVDKPRNLAKSVTVE